jgi:succinate-semialdehyde dehydrogenase/glutarate-semialdehyde dehydrogenase
MSSGSPKKPNASTAIFCRDTSRDKRIIVLKQPVGVVGIDHAVELPERHDCPQARPALAAGCTIVDQAGRGNPLLGHWPWRPWREQAGIPAGVLNVITGNAVRPSARNVFQPEAAQDHLHRLHTRSASILPANSRRTRMKKVSWSWAATRRSSSSTMPTSKGGRGCDDLQVPQQRPDLRVRQPDLCAAGVYDAFAAKLAAAVSKTEASATASADGVTTGPLINEDAVPRSSITSRTQVEQGRAKC